MAITPNVRHARYGHYARQRYSKRLLAFLAAQATRLLGSATAQTIVPIHVANTDATDVLTAGTNATAGQTVTIADIVYTIKTALTEAKAAQTLTGDGTVVADGVTVTIGAKTYTFQTTLTNVDGHVHIVSGNAASTLTNLFHAINGSGGTIGTDYATATTANADVVATNPSGTTVVVTAKAVGVNVLATTSVGAHVSWGAATLAGGLASIANEVLLAGSNTGTIDNLVVAVNAGAGGGTNYSSATVANPAVTLGARSGNTTTATAVAHGAAGNAVGVATNVTSASWATDHLAGGVTETWGPTTTATAHGIAAGEGPYVITSSNGASHVPAGYAVGTFLYVKPVTVDTILLYADAGLSDPQLFSGAGTGTISLTKASISAGIYDALKRNDARTVAGASDIDSLR